MTRNLILIYLLLLIFQPVVFGQKPEYTIGKVIDSKTSDPVPYATVRLKHSQVGVYTNAEGDFRILGNTRFQSDSLIVTCIGFQRFSMAFSVLKKNQMNLLKLQPDIYALKEVKINARKRWLSPQTIITRALNNIKNNYPVEPFCYVSYYRDYLKDSSKYLNLNEAIIQTLDNGFAYESDLNRYKLLDFKKNIDFVRRAITPYYDLPETDHSNVSFKRIPFAKVGDQYGNELFILLVHDAIRNYNKDSFSFVDTLTVNFLKNHWFSNALGVYLGNTLLYKIDFINKHGKDNSVRVKGSIYIQPNDYSIHKLEYSAYYLDSEQKKKELYKIDIEYGHEPIFDNKMMLKYISFNNLFTIGDNTFFRLVDLQWREAGGPYNDPLLRDMTIIASFNRKIDPISGTSPENFNLTIGKRTAKITRLRASGGYLYITVKDDQFNRKELDSCHLNVKKLKDIDGNILNKPKGLEFRQFRELFVQEYSKPQESQDTCFIKSMPLEQNCISFSNNSGKYWMNTPLKDEEKQQDSIDSLSIKLGIIRTP